MMKKFLKKLGFAAFVDFVFVFSVFLFIPYEVYLGNTMEFIFLLNDFWIPIAIAGVLFVGILFIHILLRGVLFDIYTSLVFGGTITCYVQSMFLNGMMSKLDGTEITWDQGRTILNLIIWIVVALIPLAIRFIKKDIWSTICKFGSLIVVGAQAAALVSLILTAQMPTLDTKLSEKGLNEVSGKNNVIVFCLDKFDQTNIEPLLEQYPNALDCLNGFTYYPNATAKYCYTHIGVPYLLTATQIPEYNPTQEQFCEQIETSEYYKYLTDNIGNVGIYTNDFCVRSNIARGMADNGLSLDYTVNQATLTKASIKAALYRVMPFMFKSRFEYSSSSFNEAIETYGSIQAYDPDTHKTEEKFSDLLEEQGLVINEEYGDTAYRFIHLKSTHPLHELDENCNYVESGTQMEQVAAGSFYLINQYCSELERLGLFEEATIIITTDHGNTFVINEGAPEGRNVNPIFFYKPSGVSRNEPYTTSLAPVSHDDIFATVLNAFGADSSDYEYCIEDITEDMERTRYYYWCKQDPEITDRESCIHVEYEINGDSRDNANWKETGNIVYPNNNPRHKDVE